MESAFVHVSGEGNGFDDRFIEPVWREDMKCVRRVEGVWLRLDIFGGRGRDVPPVTTEPAPVGCNGGSCGGTGGRGGESK